MSDKLQRLLVKARTKRREPPDTMLIICPRCEDVPARVDMLIAAGTLTEADRPPIPAAPHRKNADRGFL